MEKEMHEKNDLLNAYIIERLEMVKSKLADEPIDLTIEELKTIVGSILEKY